LAEEQGVVAGKAADMGLTKKVDADLRGYVMDRALDDLDFMCGDEETRISCDPVATGGSVLQKADGG